jgi:hypothetical protein
MATVNEVIEARRSEYSNPIMGYPPNGTHGMVLTFFSYKYGAGQPIGPAEQSHVIRLPLPNQMQDAYNINIQGNQLGVVGGLAADLSSVSNLDPSALMEMAKNAGAEAGQKLTQYVSGLEGGAGLGSDLAGAAMYLQKAGVTSIGNLLGSNVGQGISSGSGIAVNPHIALTFEGMNLKQYTMEWQLSPKNQSEMNLISDMIKKIKRRILPTYKGGGGSNSVTRGLFNYPDLVQMQYIGIDPNHIYTFKPAMATNIIVDYSPHGKSFVKGSGSQSAPGFVNITMSFTEAQIWTAEDIT